MPSQCCFWCPAHDHHERVPGELCPTCSRLYEAPLINLPTVIREYDQLAPVSRGFYSAVYRARQPSLGRIVVLKVVPVQVYDFFKKDWQAECREHAAIAADTDLVANITDQFDFDIDFGGAVLRCHVAVLENVVGPTLETVFRSPVEQGLTTRMAAQIALDLFEILHHFSEHERFHNDLHANNVIVQRLTAQQQRTGKIDPMTRAVAIDLGSVLDESKSDATSNRIGDQQQVARHMAALAAAVRDSSPTRTDVDNRLVGALQGLAEHLSPSANAQRVMTSSDALTTLGDAMRAVDEPWRQRLSLQRFGDAYNAQTMESWHVPALWFDPDDRWMARTTARGPQVITGMRGCGKTILLRSLHFHARAVSAATSPEGAVAGLDKDEFIGVYASCQKLLNPMDQRSSDGDIRRPFERLYVAYLRDSVQILRHLRALNVSALVGGIDIALADALRALELPQGTADVVGEPAFEQLLLDLQLRLSDGSQDCRLKMAPSEAFAHLADVLRRSTPALVNKYVLFLLDDVSTRYLSADMVRQVISGLLFQHPQCAFRITTEAQALQRFVLSPGGIAPADPSRDYEEFNLGSEVYRLLQEGSTTKKMEFVSEILRRRGRQFHDELYQREPIDVLGAPMLEEIATEIANSPASSPARKRVYRGLRAMQAVCVGDLGDVVKLYEKILQRATANELPVPADKQTSCFLEHSANLMHFLNRRNQGHKGLALAFAQAAGELLQRSVKNGSSKKRLRQYTKLYVRVDAGPDFEKVAGTLLDLLDAGVFVYDGGIPRTKTRDDDPVLQFKLSYRKMLGLASFIGLSDRDRFELSGETLRRWLEDPSQAMSILVESEAKSPDPDIGEDLGADEAGDVVPQPLATSSKRKSRTFHGSQLEMPFDSGAGDVESVTSHPPTLGMHARHGTLQSWTQRRFGAAVIAMGFEERALASAQRLLDALTVDRVVLVQYALDQGQEILRLVEERRVPFTIVSTIEELAARLQGAQSILVDTSGLSKPFLFVGIRDALTSNGIVSVVHTFAEQHFPRNEDLESIGVTADAQVPAEVLAKLGEDFMGEAGPYELRRIHTVPAGPDRWRALLASASPKNDRLLYLLDARSYDATRILVPPPTTARRRIAWASAEFAASAADANVGMIQVDTNDIEAALQETERVYGDLYYSSGANVEVGLTGSKIHAVAAAALAAATRVSAAWYVSPRTFDMERFTKGVGITQVFDLTLSAK